MRKYTYKRPKRRKPLYRKKKGNPVLSVFLTVLLLGVLGFLGYSIGAPIMNFLESRDKVQTGEEITTPAVTEAAAPAVTEPTEEVHVTTTGVENSVSDGYSAYSIPLASMSDVNSLRSAIDEARSLGYTAAVIDMKLSGGALTYASSVELVRGSDICIYDMSAEQIAAIVKEYHMTPIARINALTDNLIPKVDKYMGYRFENQDYSWLDNKADKGGKPWISPFSDKSVQYLCDIAAEIGSAGFEEIIISDMKFFPFRKNDLKYIGSIVQSPERYRTLIMLSNAMGTAADCRTWVEVSAADILSGSCEVFRPAEDPELSYAVLYNPADFGNTAIIGGVEKVLSEMTAAEKAAAVFSEVERLSAGREITPCISSGMSESDVREVIFALVSSGYKSYVIK